MRRQMIVAASAAILASAALAACNFGGSEKKDDAAATEGGATETSGEAASGGKPATGASGAGAATETATTGGGEAASGGKPATDAAGTGGAAAGSAPASGGGSIQRVGQVPDEFAQLMSDYLDHYVSQYGQGLRRAGPADVVTALRAGQEYRWTVNLEQGGNYGFFGACDNDCTDVDIIVEDANGREVASDVLTDDYPVVGIQNATAGRYTARILLVSCSVEPCFVGGRLLRQ